MTVTIMFDKELIRDLPYRRKSDKKVYHGKEIYTVFRHPQNQTFIFKWGDRLFLFDPDYSQNPEYLKNPYRETVLCMKVFDCFFDSLEYVR